MAKFKIGDKVIVNNGIYVGVIKSIDEISMALPVYNIYVPEENIIVTYYEPALKRVYISEDTLRYGEILTDDKYYYYTHFPKKENYVRIRTIRYESHIFYHKMVNGEVVEFKELTV